MIRPLLFEHIATARESLRRTRTRTMLSVIGIAIGVASITAILALSGGITHVIDRQIKNTGDNLLIVKPKVQTNDSANFTNPLSVNQYTTSPLDESDLELVYINENVKIAAPLMTVGGTVKYNNGPPVNATILSTTPSFTETSPLVLSDGQFIDSVTLENTAVLGAQTAIDLFGTEQAVGKSFKLRGENFTTIGVIKRQQSPLNYNNIDFDSSVIISFDSGKLFNHGIAQIQQINVIASNNANLEKLRGQLTKVISKNHSGDRDVNVLIGKEITTPTNQLFNFMRTMLAMIAGISLVVGGIGVMNIMLVSVAERVREIGLRKSVGATTGSIAAQFLIEALITCSIGGFIGFISGYAVAFTASRFLPYDPLFSWDILLTALLLSIGIGIIFGLYPAIRAARKQPIESLRHSR
jgi:putative ABC transport system permease protein